MGFLNLKKHQKRYGVMLLNRLLSKSLFCTSLVYFTCECFFRVSNRFFEYHHSWNCCIIKSLSVNQTIFICQNISTTFGMAKMKSVQIPWKLDTTYTIQCIWNYWNGRPVNFFIPYTFINSLSFLLFRSYIWYLYVWNEL